MRESRKIEKTHLPRDTVEVWLESQKTKPSEAKHKSPAADVFEVWMEKQVVKKVSGSAAHRKRTPRASSK